MLNSDRILTPKFSAPFFRLKSFCHHFLVPRSAFVLPHTRTLDLQQPGHDANVSLTTLTWQANHVTLLNAPTTRHPFVRKVRIRCQGCQAARLPNNTADQMNMEILDHLKLVLQIVLAVKGSRPNTRTWVGRVAQFHKAKQPEATHTNMAGYTIPGVRSDSSRTVVDRVEADALTPSGLAVE